MSRIALITGGTSGIGAAIAKELKSAGYTVAVNYHGNDDKAKDFYAKTNIPIYKWNVGEYEECVKGIERLRSDIGDPEILVNNAGITRDRMMHKMSEQEWHEVIHVNLNSVFITPASKQFTLCRVADL